MGKERKFGQLFGAAILCLTLLLAGLASPDRAQSSEVDARADQLLRQMSDYLAGLKQFSVQTENSLEVLLRSGEKIQYDTPAELIMQRPDKLKAERTGDIVNQEFYYDGKTLSLYQKDSNYFASVEAPDTIDATIDFARDYLGVYAPGSDLIYANPYAILTESAVSGSYVGESVVDGTRCHHLAFRNDEVDWQIWIAAGDKPLPRKFVVTSKWMTGAPQFTLVTRNWNLSPKITDKTFSFVPPKEAKQIDFVVLNGASASER
jgi:hypothetical protein